MQTQNTVAEVSTAMQGLRLHEVDAFKPMRVQNRDNSPSDISTCSDESNGMNGKAEALVNYHASILQSRME